MRLLYLLTIIYIGFALSSCTSCTDTSCPPPTVIKVKRHVEPICVKPRRQLAEKKNPLTVSFYSKSQLNRPYEVIGEERISKFNIGGHKRQEAYIRDGMRELAAAMGGDAIIDIKHDDQFIKGTVVAFKKDKEDKKV